MILSQATLKSYNESRHHTDKKILCHAPFTNLNFDQFGNVRACCYNKKDLLGKWPDQSIKDIWEGLQIAQLKSHILNNDLGGGCIECAHMISAGNYNGARAKGFDEFGYLSTGQRLAEELGGKSKINYPRVMEFETSNVCNLECIMCSGDFSSSIRKNREKLPPLISPYTNSFVDELEEFLPYLTDAKFLGGEPFMIDLYLDIWERITKVNPKIKVHITTNGTFLNGRIKELLERMKAGIIVSLDSLQKETYSAIRVNGNYDKVMENLNYFVAYGKQRRRDLSIAMCPMTLNWKELPAMLDFCLERGIVFFLNTVFWPEHLSLKHQSIGYLEEVIAFLEKNRYTRGWVSARSARNLSISAYTDFISQLKGWLKEKKDIAKIEHDNIVAEQAIYEPIKKAINELSGLNWSLESAAKTIKSINDFAGDERLQMYVNELQNIFSSLLIDTPNGKLHEVFQLYFDKDLLDSHPDLRMKIRKVSENIEGYSRRDDVLAAISKSPFQSFAAILQTREETLLLKDLSEHFPV